MKHHQTGGRSGRVAAREWTMSPELLALLGAADRLMPAPAEGCGETIVETSARVALGVAPEGLDCAARARRARHAAARSRTNYGNCVVDLSAFAAVESPARQ